jgi:hypothetical protein
MSWPREFDDPIPLPRGRQLVTLQDAADYIMKLPKAEQNLVEWQTAVGCLIGAAEGREFLMHEGEYLHIDLGRSQDAAAVPLGGRTSCRASV